MRFKDIFKGEKESWIDVLLGKETDESKIKMLAIAHAIDLIARTIAKTEIQVYRYRDKKIIKAKDEAYYKLNIRPNINENATSFFYRAFVKMLTEQNALVIINKDKQLFLADDYNSSKEIMKEKEYSNIVIIDNEENTLNLDKKYKESEVLHFSLINLELEKALKEFSYEISKITEKSRKKYNKDSSEKWKMKIPGNQPPAKDPKTGADITYDDYKNKITKGLNSEEDTIILLSEYFDLFKLNENNKPDSSNYINNLKTTCDYVAMKFKIPLSVFYGNQTEKTTANNDFITYAIGPVLENIEDELNGKLFSKEEYLKGERIKINKFNMKHYDIMDISGPIDKLKGSGFSHNDIEEFLGLPLTDEEWAKKHYVTKNYGDVKGGEETNE